MTDEVYDVYYLRGIGERINAGLLSFVIRSMNARTHRFTEIRWLAEYGPFPHLGGADYISAMLGGKQQLTAAANRSRINGRKFKLIGYSGGANTVGDWCIEHPELKKYCAGVVLIADPSQPTNIVVGGFQLVGSVAATRFGIRGSRTIPGWPVRWFADTADTIPLAFADPNPLRDLARVSASFSLADPVAWLRSDALRTLPPLSARLKGLSDLAAVRDRYERAGHDALGYLALGNHTSYHIRKMQNNMTYCEVAGRWLSTQE